ncbi:MAG: DUF6884 domain-containing protein [Crinalium sp.]
MKQSKYFAVIGKTDYLLINQKRYGLWELLEAHLQPYGWLCSIFFNQAIIPSNLPIIWDVGAWSYRWQEIPQVRGNLVNANWAILEYQRRNVKPGDIIIPPDMILLPGTNLTARREFNRTNAIAFLELAAKRMPWCSPMAVIHGATVNEKLENAEFLYQAGYKVLAVGGMASQAGSKQDNLQTITAIRNFLPDTCYLHVLGLCSPRYAKAFNKIGIDSYDGSSYLIEAIKAGKFLIAQGEKLIKHQIKELHSKINIPVCSCYPCSLLRHNGFDTRTYGSHQSNHGRATHNLGALVLAQKTSTRQRTVALIACVSKKSTKSAIASELYISQWFKAAKRYVEKLGVEYLLLSARHGVVLPKEMLEPYEQSPYKLTIQERREWGIRVVEKLKYLAPENTEFIILGGKHYREFVIPPLLEAGYHVKLPLLGLGIGKQLQWLKQRVAY